MSFETMALKVSEVASGPPYVTPSFPISSMASYPRNSAAATADMVNVSAVHSEWVEHQSFMLLSLSGMIKKGPAGGASGVALEIHLSANLSAPISLRQCFATQLEWKHSTLAKFCLQKVTAPLPPLTCTCVVLIVNNNNNIWQLLSNREVWFRPFLVRDGGGVPTREDNTEQTPPERGGRGTDYSGTRGSGVVPRPRDRLCMSATKAHALPPGLTPSTVNVE